MRIRIAILPFLALGTAAAPCGAQGGGNEVPRELVQALLFPLAAPGHADPDIAVGRLPDGVPAGLIPPEATVMGGLGESAVFTLAQPPAEAIAGWRAQLERVGWRAPDDPSLRASPGALGLCGPDRTTFLAGWASPLPQGGSELQVRVGRGGGSYFPCSGTRMPTTGDVPFPALRTPEGGQRMGGGDSSTPDERTVAGLLRTTRSPAEVAADLVGQLRQEGWDASDPRADAGGATAWAKLRDESGKDWRAVVAVLPVADSVVFSVVRVAGDLAEPRYPQVDLAPVARAAGPPVPGELVRALLGRPSGQGYEIRPTLVSGRLPQELAGTPLPPGSRAVGGMVDPDQVEGVVFVPGEPLSLAAYRETLQRAGWRSRRVWVLVSPGATDDRSEFCDANGRVVNVGIVPLRDGGSYLELWSHGPAGLCGPNVLGSLDESPLPLLPAPAGAEMRGGTGGWGGSPWEEGGHGCLETALSPLALVEHYAGLLRQAGWTTAPPTADESAATATAELRDAQGNTWHALIAVASLSPTARDVMVQAVRPRAW